VKSNSVSPARLTAFEILRRVGEGAYASVLLASREDELSPPDRALCHELVMGVLRRQLWLDRLLEHYANRKSGLDESVRIILRIGLYQLRFLSRVPASAAVNESVNLVHFARLRSAGSFVNAVLRRATREPEIDPTSNIQDPLEHVSVATSHPQWLIERWTKAFGNAEAEALAHANNDAAPVAFRVVKSRAQEGDGEAAYRRRLTRREPDFALGRVTRRGGEPDREDHDAHVHEQTAVETGIAAHGTHRRDGNALRSDPGAGAHTDDHRSGDAREREGPKCEGGHVRNPPRAPGDTRDEGETAGPRRDRPARWPTRRARLSSPGGTR